MELGKARLRKVGINNLNRAVHDHHGVMWTDGRGIYLAPLYVEGKQMQNATSVRLGEFDTVTSVHWSNPIHQVDSDGPASCHMAVVHQNNVTVWRVSGTLPKLSFKQVRKINVRPIAQGCLWNPMTDTLCLLSRHQCSFYFRHDHNKGSHAVPPLDSGKISCGCWSSDGKKLIVCVGASLLIYRWPDVSENGNDGAALTWIIPGLVGDITSITPMPKNKFVLATEVPLESLCRKQESHDAFIMPDGSHSKTAGNDDVIRPSSSPSVTQSLMNLQTNTQLREASSSLTLIKVHEGMKDPTKVFTCSVNGLLTPDILLYERSSQCVVVGSNSQSQLHIYALLEKRLAYCGDIQLEKSQRPKGLCSVPTYFDDRGAALLILVGQRTEEDAGFLSASTETEFQLSLKYIIIKAGYGNKTKDSSHGDSFKSRSTANVRSAGSLSKSESMRERNSSSSGDSKLRLRSGSDLSDGNQNVSQTLSSTGLVEDSNDHNQIITNPAEKESLSPGLTQSQVTPSQVSTFNRSTPSPSSLIQPSHQHTVSTSSSSPRHKTPLIQDMGDHNGTALTKEDLEVEPVSFSSQPPSFSNEKLSYKYQLDTEYRSRRREMEKDAQASKSESLPLHSQQNTQPSQQLQNGSESNSSSLNTIHLPHQRRQSDRPSVLNGTEVQKSELPDKAKPSARPKSKSSLTYHSPASSPREDHKRLTNGRGKDDMATSDLGSSHHSTDSSFDSMEKQVKSQKDNIDALYRRLEELSTSVKEASMVFPTKYQDMQTPELVTVTCTKANSKSQTSKKFLLDNGRLQLEPIKLAFGLATVELWLDGLPIVLGSNIDGYIPLKFSPSSTIHISGIPSDASTLPTTTQIS